LTRHVLDCGVVRGPRSEREILVIFGQCEAVIAKTNSRSHLGPLNDFADKLRWQLHGQEDLDLVQEAIELAHTPVRPLWPLGFPDKVTRQLLAG